jgi:hypothetical protein
MVQEEFNDFRLVGGTSLALQFGHRKSIDIDLFGSVEIDRDNFLAILQTHSSNVEVVASQKNIFICIVNGIKLDFVNYKFLWIDNLLISNNIRMAKPKDIAAMKLNAIAGRGKKKDFVDIELLLNHYSLKEMISFYKEKYNQISEFMVLKSLLYFGDADIDEDPQMLIPFDWSKTKIKISHSVKKYNFE